MDFTAVVEVLGEEACVLSPGGVVLDDEGLGRTFVGREFEFLGVVPVDGFEVLFLSTIIPG